MTAGKTALFVTCLVDQFFPRVGEAAVRLVEACGREVDFPAAQTCCGQPAFNMGYRREARRLAKRFIEIFEPYEEIVAPSGSCVSMVRVHFPEILEDEPGYPPGGNKGGRNWKERARQLAERVYELTEYLEKRGFDAGASPYAGRVTCHDSCHLLRELGIRGAPRALLAQVPGVELVEMEGADVCCGFGGAFAEKMPDLSGAMLDDKLEHAEATGASVLTAADCGCLMHLGGALKRRGSALEAVHVAEILAWDSGESGHDSGDGP